MFRGEINGALFYYSVPLTAFGQKQCLIIFIMYNTHNILYNLMIIMVDTCSKTDIIALLDASVAINPQFIEQPDGGFVLLIIVNGKEKCLRTFRGQIRVFKKPETVVNFAQKLRLPTVCFSLYYNEENNDKK